MSEKPLVSVIMAAYNAERFVADAIRSIQEQTYDNWELICVDDCSTDGTYEILLQCARGDPRIKVLQNEDNLGCAATRNIALEHAQGELIALQDADDMSLPDRFERSLPALAEADVVGSDVYVVNEYGHRVGRYFAGWNPQKKSPWEWLIAGRVLFMEPTLLAYRKGIPEPLCNPLFRVAVLYDLLLRMAALGRRFVKLPKPVYIGRRRRTQVTNRLAYEAYFVKGVAIQGALALKAGREFDYQAALEEMKRDPLHQARAHLRAGWLALQREDIQTARQHFAQAMERPETCRQARLLNGISHLPHFMRGVVVACLTKAAEYKPAMVRLLGR